MKVKLVPTAKEVLKFRYLFIRAYSFSTKSLINPIDSILENMNMSTEETTDTAMVCNVGAAAT
jgi:hypothetical protein